MYFLAIWTTSFDNFLFNSCVHVFIKILIIWRLSFLSYENWQRFFPILWIIYCV
jgi:predicted ferric reductase